MSVKEPVLKKISNKKLFEVMKLRKLDTINNDVFWKDYRINRLVTNAELDDPNWISQCQASTDANRRTLDYILKTSGLAILETKTKKSIGKLLSISEHIIREEANKGRILTHPSQKSRHGNPYVWWPDVLNLAVGFMKSMEARIVDLMGEMNVGDLSKYLIADITQFRTGVGLNEIQVNYLWKLHNDFFSHDYALVPKSDDLNAQNEAIKQALGPEYTLTKN